MQSVPLWCDYANFVEEHDQSVSQCLPAGISKMRDLFERALTAAGLHIVEGSKIWEAYREYEQALFLTISDGNDEVEYSGYNYVSTLSRYLLQGAFTYVFLQCCICKYA